MEAADLVYKKTLTVGKMLGVSSRSLGSISQRLPQSPPISGKAKNTFARWVMLIALVHR